MVSLVSEKRCINDCNGLGICNNITGECNCNDGYNGKDCSGMHYFAIIFVIHCKYSSHSEQLCKDSCNGRGICNSTTGTCLCNDGFSGSFCEGNYITVHLMVRNVK